MYSPLWFEGGSTRPAGQQNVLQRGAQGKVSLPESINEANGENVDQGRKREWTAVRRIGPLGTNCGLLYDFLCFNG